MTVSRFTALSAVALVCGLAAPAYAADGVQLVQQVTVAGQTRTSQAQIEKTRMRTEVTGVAGGTQVVFFDGAKQVLTIVDMGAKTYSELTAADLDKLSAQMSGAMAMMQAQMANMPPAQRAQMEALMSGRGMAMAAPAKPEYRKGGTAKVGRWTCNVYEAYQNGQKTGDVCTVDAAALGFGASDFAVANQMATFFSKMVPGGASQISGFGTAESQGFVGFPVKTTSTSNGQTVTTEVTEASRQNFADSVFAIPTGFTKKELIPNMGGAAAGRGR